MQTKDGRIVPDDVCQALSTLYSKRHELPDVMTEPVIELAEQYREDMREWAETGREPDWDAYRVDINDMCREDGMPTLCNEVI